MSGKPATAAADTLKQITHLAARPQGAPDQPVRGPARGRRP